LAAGPPKSWIPYFGHGPLLVKKPAGLQESWKNILEMVSTTGADFSCIFFHGKSLSAEFSSEFLGKAIFRNFFRGKFQFSSTFFLVWRGDFRGLFWQFFATKGHTARARHNFIVRVNLIPADVDSQEECSVYVHMYVIGQSNFLLPQNDQ
jgi:hypothetical protein